MSPSFRRFVLSVLVVLSFSVSLAAADNWPQPAGPNGNWSVTGHNVPTHWSLARNENIVWRTTLPEEGQSGIAVWGDRLFLTTMKPLAADATKKEGHDVVGYCLDSRTGKILWTVDLPGVEDSVYAYGFSDSTSASPVTDGKHVWFYNTSGSLGCFDFNGKPVWMRRWQPTNGRPFNKQFEPMLIGNTLVNMEPRDVGDTKRETKDPWNYLRGLDKNTGKTLWVSEDSLTHYNTPVFGHLPDGTPAILQGRGGYHDVPETPVGLTLTSLAPGQEGNALWRFGAVGKALYTQHWDSRHAYWFAQETSDHQVIDIQTGKLVKTQSLVNRVDLRRFDPATGQYLFQHDLNLKQATPPTVVFPSQFCNIVAEGYHYFLCFTDAEQHLGPAYCIGRVNIATDKVEYLELPVSVTRAVGQPDRFIWGQPQPSSTVNSRGIDVAEDPRSKRDGWYWCYLGSPTRVDGKIYITTMLGLTYVIDARAKTLDARALLSVNDLGTPGTTWSLNSISYANGKLFHRSIKEVVCIGTK